MADEMILTADYVVESGTDGIWIWRKWESGLAECWGSQTINTILNKEAVSGTHYYGESPFAPIDYPIQFVSKPKEFATYAGAGTDAAASGDPAWLYTMTDNTETATGRYNLMRWSAYKNYFDYNINYYVVGVWKENE